MGGSSGGDVEVSSVLLALNGALSSSVNCRLPAMLDDGRSSNGSGGDGVGGSHFSRNSSSYE